jgi:hypothetical protein
MRHHLYTRPRKQRMSAPELVNFFYWETMGTGPYARKEIRRWYKDARRLLQLSPYQARTYTFGRMVETTIFSIRKMGEE